MRIKCMACNRQEGTYTCIRCDRIVCKECYDSDYGVCNYCYELDIDESRDTEYLIDHIETMGDDYA